MGVEGFDSDWSKKWGYGSFGSSSGGKTGRWFKQNRMYQQQWSTPSSVSRWHKAVMDSIPLVMSVSQKWYKIAERHLKALAPISVSLRSLRQGNLNLPRWAFITIFLMPIRQGGNQGKWDCTCPGEWSRPCLFFCGTFLIFFSLQPRKIKCHYLASSIHERG